MGDDGRVLATPPGLGYTGAVVEGMGAGHLPSETAPRLEDLASRMPMVLASRSMTGPVFINTYDYAALEIDLIGRGLLPAGFLSGLKARLLLFAARREAPRSAIEDLFAAYR